MVVTSYFPCGQVKVFYSCLSSISQFIDSSFFVISFEVIIVVLKLFYGSTFVQCGLSFQTCDPWITGCISPWFIKLCSWESCIRIAFLHPGIKGVPVRYLAKKGDIYLQPVWYKWLTRDNICQLL